VDVARIQAHCLAEPGAWADNPWGHDLPVIEVHDKIFAFLGAAGVSRPGR
jgi:predicted DNA-binding protein (MmcQ/YjbR family)